MFGTLRAIDEGLKPTDRVIVNGIQRARPGGVVKAELKPIPSEAFHETAPGSPATQALPATRYAPEIDPIKTSPGSMPLMPTEPTTRPAAFPSTQPTGGNP
jgi:hypothetical protein